MLLPAPVDDEFRVRRIADAVDNCLAVDIKCRYEHDDDRHDESHSSPLHGLSVRSAAEAGAALSLLVPNLPSAPFGQDAACDEDTAPANVASGRAAGLAHSAQWSCRHRRVDLHVMRRARRWTDWPTRGELGANLVFS